MAFTQHLEQVRAQFFPLKVPTIKAEVDVCTDAALFKAEIAKIYDRAFPSSEQSFTAPQERRAATERLRGRYAESHQENLLLREDDGSVTGWLLGEMEDPETFYIRTVGIVHERRNARIPGYLYPHLIRYLRALGYERVITEHHPNNRRVIMLQLHAGFTITGFTVDERWGPQVKMVRYLHDDRELEFQRRLRLPDYEGRR